MLQRLHQPTAATVAAEYENITKLNAFMAAAVASALSGTLPTVTLPQEQFVSMMQRWCSMTKPLLLLMMNQDAASRHPSAAAGAGMLLSLWSNCLECWTGMAADETAKLVVQQQIAQLTAGECCGSGRVGERPDKVCRWGGASRRGSSAAEDSSPDSSEVAV
jgi:hypothetical protein